MEEEGGTRRAAHMPALRIWTAKKRDATEIFGNKKGLI
jgi:hypothetical protein